MRARLSLPVSLRVYRGLTRSVTPLAGAMLKWRLRNGKEDPDRIGERRGQPSAERPAGALVWAHAASVGELVAILQLIERVHARGFHVLLTTGTVTAAKLAERRLPEGVIHQFVPLDMPYFVARFLNHWRPNLALIAESELWPNLITEGRKRGIPFVLVNGRLSPRSYSRWKKLGRSAAALLSRVDLCLAQDADDAERFANLGAQRVLTTGNLKFDVPPPPVTPVALAAMERAIRGRPIVLSASTHEGEETLLIEAHMRLRQTVPGLLTMIAPRHPHRGYDIADIAERVGAVPVIRSRGHLPDAGTEIYIADTIGELGLFYRIAPIVFMGGSLVKHGGQNPIEPAKLNSAILHGPHIWNFSSVYAKLNRARGAATVTTAESLTKSLALLLDDPDLVLRMAQAAKTTVDQLGGALDRTFAAIEPYLVQLRLAR